MYEEFSALRDKDLDLNSLRKEVDFYKSENALLKNLIEERDLFSKEYMLTKILLDKQSPYLKSLIINKGQKNGVKLGSAVKDRLYYIGKVVNVNFLSLLDINNSRLKISNDVSNLREISLEYKVSDGFKVLGAINKITGDKNHEDGTDYTFNQMENFSHYRLEIKYYF